MDKNNDEKYIEVNIDDSGFIYGDNGPEVSSADFDRQEKRVEQSQGLDFPNKRIEEENRQAQIEQLQEKKSFLEKLKDKFKGNKKGGIR